jgi:amino acid transporter
MPNTLPPGPRETSPPDAGAASSAAGQIGLAAAVSIGIGGMVGAGIFSILGVVAATAGNALWLSFAIGGVVALLSTYSYAFAGEGIYRRATGRRIRL